MNPEEAAHIQRAQRAAQARRDHELELFNTTAGSRAKLSHPLFGSRQSSASPTSGLGGLVKDLPAPAGLTQWGTLSPAAIEHVGGGYHIVVITLIAEDEDWYDEITGPTRWSLAVWLIRPDASVSDAWVSPGYIQTGYVGALGFDVDRDGPPYGEPSGISTPKLTRWQEGALLVFTTPVQERQYLENRASFWPQTTYDVPLDVPDTANIYRHIGHDGTDPIVGAAFELYGGPDGDFDLKGDWAETESTTVHDDSTVEGFEVIGPSADTNIAVYGRTWDSGRHRVWLLSKNTSNVLSLVERTTLHTSAQAANPGGLTRIAADRWISMASRPTAIEGMIATLFNAKTGTIIDTEIWDDAGIYVDCYYAVGFYVYYAGNHLHFDGQATFAGWVALPETGVLGHRYTTLTVDGDVLSAGDVEEWETETRVSRGGTGTWGHSMRYVETCQGCLRLIDNYTVRQQAIFENRGYKFGFGALVSPDFEFDEEFYADQRSTPSSHPAGYMWVTNVSLKSAAFAGAEQVKPLLIRYPA